MFLLLHSQLEKQVHEDEEFARTLAMLDEEPKAKKVKAASVKKVCAIKFSSLFQVVSFVFPTIQARKGSDEKQVLTTSPKKKATDAAAPGSSSKTSVSEDVVSPSPKKTTAPVKASSKLAMMKKKDDDKNEGVKSKTPTKMKISPKKEPHASSISEKTFTPKTGTTPTALKTSPKKPEVSHTDDLSDQRKKKPEHIDKNIHFKQFKTQIICLCLRARAQALTTKRRRRPTLQLTGTS